MQELGRYQEGRGRFGFSESLISQEREVCTIWDQGKALNDIIALFPDQQEKEVIQKASEIAREKLADRWSIGFQPILQYYPNSQIGVLVPSARELSKNNRYRHVLEVARMGVVLADSFDLSSQERLVATVASLSHDNSHGPFSHTADSLLEEIRASFQGDFGSFTSSLDKHNLSGTHEERLIKEINADSRIGNFLRDTFGGVEEIERALREEGVIGEILKHIDTAAYVKLDSEFFGYNSPNYENAIKRDLYIAGRDLPLGSESKGEVTAQILKDRKNLFQTQYFSLPTRILEQMQVEAFKDFIFTKSEDPTNPEKVAWTLNYYFQMGDSQLLYLLRKAGFEKRDPRYASFFGIIPNDIGELIEGLSVKRWELEVRNGHKPKIISVYNAKEGHTVEIGDGGEDLVENLVFTSSQSFEEQIAGVLMKFYPDQTFLSLDEMLKDPEILKRDFSYHYFLPEGLRLLL